MAAEKTKRNGAKPFLKWVGGKRKVLKWLRDLYPPSYGRYYEPFVGGGAVFFDLGPRRATLSDTNGELIECYCTVRDRVDELIEALKIHVYDKEYYYRIREQDPGDLDPVKRAARMISLNHTGFNGLYRVNSKGKFNVPFGRYVNPTICAEPTLRACSSRLANSRMLEQGFEKVLSSAKKNDFVYLDPPYIPLSKTANFTAYQKRGFGMDNQERLADVFDELSVRGVFAMLSNSNGEWVHGRYSDYKIAEIEAARQINSVSTRRGPVGEIVVTNY